LRQAAKKKRNGDPSRPGLLGAGAGVEGGPREQVGRERRCLNINAPGVGGADHE